jgi:hypothetical protein
VTSRTHSSTEERSERTAAKVAAAQELLAEQVAALRSGEDWQRFLAFQAKLHQYSPNNVLLIHAQHTQAHAIGLVDAPEPSYVAGFKTWKALGRSVTKGQHGYAILAPVAGLRRLAVDPSGERRLLDAGEQARPGETEERHRLVRGFRVSHVFDVSQTTGEPLPGPTRPQLLRGEAPLGLGAAVLALLERQGFSVSTVADAQAIGGANGQTNWAERTVVVRADMDDAAMVKTLVHEAAHVLLHEGAPDQLLPRPIKEVEAESVAFVVASAHGMATDDYSFPYVAAWAGDDPVAAIQATQRRVAGAARVILEASPAEHGSGGKVPGTDLAVDGARADRGAHAPEGGVAPLPEPMGL